MGKFNLTGPAFEFDSLRNINMDFLVSDIMEDSMVGYSFYDGFNCKDTDGGANDITENDGYLLSRLRTDLVPIGDGSGERTIKVNVNLDPEKIVDSGLYHEKEGSNGNRASIEFCLRFSVYNADKADPNTMEVNFLENLVTLDINLMNDFSLDVNLAKADRVVQDAYMDTAVEAYICDSEDNVLTIEETKIEKNQGETVRICVSPTRRALDDGAKMRSLESFTFYIPDTSGATTGNIVEQVAIFPNTGGVPADPLTIVSCDPGTIVCAFETLLNANFFQTSSNAVFGEGSAYLMIGTSLDGEEDPITTGRRRRTKTNLQEEEAVAMAATATATATATKMTVRTRTLQFDEDGNPLSGNSKTANELLAERPTNFKNDDRAAGTKDRCRKSVRCGSLIDDDERIVGIHSGGGGGGNDRAVAGHEFAVTFN